MQTPVCGIQPDQDLSTVSDAALQSLLAELGRNGQVEPGSPQAIREQEIEAILAERKQSGVSVSAKGGIHHQV